MVHVCLLPVDHHRHSVVKFVHKFSDYGHAPVQRYLPGLLGFRCLGIHDDCSSPIAEDPDLQLLLLLHESVRADHECDLVHSDIRHFECFLFQRTLPALCSVKFSYQALFQHEHRVSLHLDSRHHLSRRQRMVQIPE